MSLESLVNELVDDRSLDALERLTGSRQEDVLEALVEAAGRILGAEHSDPSDDDIVDTLRQHLVETRAVGVLVDSLQNPDLTTCEFALSCLSQIGDIKAFEPMVRLLEEGPDGTREAAAEHLSLLTSYDFGANAAKWREWQQRRVQGLVEQAEEDREDQARRLRLQMRGNTKATDTTS